VKKRRRDEVMALQQRVAFRRAADLAREFDEKNPRSGRRLEVVIDAALRTSGKKTSGVSEGGGLYQGRTYFQAPQIDSVTFVHAKEKLSPGELIGCPVGASDGYDLIARPTAELDKKVGLRVLR